MIKIKAIEDGKADKADNVMKNAPHAYTHLLSDKWDHPYTREQAAYPMRGLRSAKYFPPVSRIDGAFGDRNVFCSCPPLVAD